MARPPPIPLDILISILSHLPPERTRSDLSAKTIGRFATCSRLFRDAASNSTLWIPHYEERFIYCDADKEEERLEVFQSDYSKMYGARKRLEVRALELVRRLMTERKTRHQSVQELTELSEDVWDVLELETQCPLPPSFEHRTNWKDKHGVVPPNPLTWKYWSIKALAVISRHIGIREISQVNSREDHSEEGSEEEEMDKEEMDEDFLRWSRAQCSLSTFFSIHPSEVEDRLTEVTTMCVSRLQALGLIQEEPPDLPLSNEICIEISKTLRSRRFRLPHGQDEENLRRDLLNNFPHAYLTTHKRSNHLSLAHVFTHVASEGFDLYVSPVVLSGVVLCRVDVPDDDFFFVHPEGRILTAAQLQVSPKRLIPTPGAKLLLRVSKNIMASLPDQRWTAYPKNVTQSAFMCALCLSFLFSPDDDSAIELLSARRHLPPMECYSLSVSLCPLVNEERQEYLEEYCRQGLEWERREAFDPLGKHHMEYNVKHYVGQVFRHRKIGYDAVIVGWDDRFDESRERLRKINIIDNRHNNRPIGDVNQPWYHAYEYDTGYLRYVAQEHVQLMPLSPDLAANFMDKNPEMGRYFSDVLIGGMGNDRGFFRLSPETKLDYPDDDWCGAKWVEEGTEALAEQAAAVEAFAEEFKDYL